MKQEKYDEIKRKALEMFRKARIVLTETEKNAMEVADFGLHNVEVTGLQLITYVNTEKVCAKELALLPNQTCPEHKHPKRDFDDGKEETFRCKYGKVYLYVSGPETEHRSTQPPIGDEDYYTGSSLNQAVNTPYPLIHCTGSRPEMKEPSSPNSPQRAPTKATSLPTPESKESLSFHNLNEAWGRFLCLIFYDSLLVNRF